MPCMPVATESCFHVAVLLGYAWLFRWSAYGYPWTCGSAVSRVLDAIRHQY